MKKIISVFLLLSLVLSLSACGKTEITTQDIYDANQTEALLKNHQSIYVLDEVDGEFYSEKYLTKEYVYDYIHEEEFDWMEFTTDNSSYFCYNGEYMRFWSISPEGVNSDFASYRAERYASAILGAETTRETIEAVSKEDDRLTVTTIWGQEILEDFAEYGITSSKFEHVVDANTYEVISVAGEYALDDGTANYVITEVTYDADVPEQVKAFLEYDNQTENLRNITVVTNPGTEKEVSQEIQVAKGLIIGFEYDEEFENKLGVYSDADCTEPYDPYQDTDSDMTIYVKFNV